MTCLRTHCNYFIFTLFEIQLITHLYRQYVITLKMFVDNLRHPDPGLKCRYVSLINQINGAIY